MFISLIIVIALLLDAAFGEPRRWHPLVGFGNLANWLEQKLNKQKSQIELRLSGLVAWALIVLPFVVAVYFLQQISRDFQFEIYTGFKLGLDVIIAIIFLTLAIGAKSLVQHAKAVSKALINSDINLARKNVALIVSRDTCNSDEATINKATIESVLENGSDAIFAAIFWFIILGAPGVVLYRLANTLDAMWGYRTERFLYFGWGAARMDDVLNWLPARLTSISYALAGNTIKAFSCWKNQAKDWHGINPGVVMASGAGALNVILGGVATYHGQKINRPELGCNNEPQIADIDRAIHLIYKSIFIWILLIVTGDYLIV